MKNEKSIIIMLLSSSYLYSALEMINTHSDGLAVLEGRSRGHSDLEGSERSSSGEQEVK